MANKATNKAAETANETVETNVTETANETKTTKKVAKKPIIIPINDKDPDTFVPVVINGKITTITKGVPVEVDDEVYNILLRAGYLGTKAK